MVGCVRACVWTYVHLSRQRTKLIWLGVDYLYVTTLKDLKKTTWRAFSLCICLSILKTNHVATYHQRKTEENRCLCTSWIYYFCCIILIQIRTKIEIKDEEKTCSMRKGQEQNLLLLEYCSIEFDRSTNRRMVSYRRWTCHAYKFVE